MPKRIFYDGGGERKLVYKCDACRRMHDTHEDAVACEHGHVKMLADKPAVGRHLGRVAPRIVAAHDNGASVGVRPGEVSQRQRVGCDMHTD